MVKFQKLDIVEDHFMICRLLAAYGELLTERSRELAKLYFVEDLSITEIAEYLQISRQAVHYNLKRTVEQLTKYERKLDIISRSDKVSEMIDELRDLLLKDESSEAAKKLADIEAEYKVL